MQRGFSLVELSIVLVILGLLTGGILAGQSLIRAAELRAASAEFQRYMAATQTFRDKYMAIPGDMSNATRFWGRTVNAAHCLTNSSAAVSSPGTCDGTGNGTIDLWNAASQSAESYQYWNQLALADLIEGSFTGFAGSGGLEHAIAGTNVPASKISNSAWYVSYIAPAFIGDGSAYALDYGNHFRFGGQTAATWPVTKNLKPEEAWNIDIKLDDGKPASGKVIAYYWSNACAAADDGTSANNDLVASYRLNDTALQCVLFFRQIF